MGMATAFRWPEVREFFPDDREEVRCEYRQDETITGINGTCAPQQEVDEHSWCLFERWIEESAQYTRTVKALVETSKLLKKV